LTNYVYGIIIGKGSDIVGEKRKKKRKEVLGGFLPDPPENCEKKECIVEVDGRKWIDYIICSFRCERNRKCKRYKEYTKELRERRKK